MAERLTRLQQAILETHQHGIPVRDAMRIVSFQVGFFVGQQRYEDELAKALQILEAQESGSVGNNGA